MEDTDKKEPGKESKNDQKQTENHDLKEDKENHSTVQQPETYSLVNGNENESITEQLQTNTAKEDDKENHSTVQQTETGTLATDNEHENNKNPFLLEENSDDTAGKLENTEKIEKEGEIKETHTITAEKVDSEADKLGNASSADNEESNITVSYQTETFSQEINDQLKIEKLGNIGSELNDEEKENTEEDKTENTSMADNEENAATVPRPRQTEILSQESNGRLEMEKLEYTTRVLDDEDCNSELPRTLTENVKLNDVLQKEIERLKNENEELLFSEWNYDKLKEEIDDLNKKLKDAKEESSSLRNEKKKMDDALCMVQSLRVANEQLTFKGNRLEEENENTEAENSKMQTRISNLSNKIAELTNKTHTLEKVNSDMKNEISNNKTRHSNLQKQVEIAEKDKEDQQIAHKNLEQSLKEKTCEIERLNNELQHIVNESKAKEISANRPVSDEAAVNEMMEYRLKEQQQELDTVLKSVADKEMENTTLRQQLEQNFEEKTSEVERLNNELKSIVTENKNSKIKSDNKIQEHLKTIERLDNEISTLKAKETLSNKSESDVYAENKKMEHTLKTLQQERDTALKSVLDYEVTNKELQKKLDLKVNEYQERNQQYKQVTELMEKTKDENQRLLCKVSDVESERCKLMDNCSQTDANIHEQEKRISVLETERNNLKVKVDTAVSEKTTADMSLSILNKDLTESNQEVTRLQTIVNSYQPKYEEVLQQEEKWRKEWHTLVQVQQADKEERHRVESLKLELDKRKSDLARNEWEINKKDTEMLQKEQELKTKIDTLEANLAATEEQSTRLKGKLDTASVEVSNCQASLTGASESNTVLKAEIQDTKRILVVKEDEISKLQGLCNTLRNTEIALSKENSTFTNEIMRLSSQMVKDREHLEKFTETEKANVKNITEQGEVIKHLSRQIQDEKEINATLNAEKQDLSDEWTSKYREKSTEFELESANCKKLSDENTRLFNCTSEQGKEIKKLQEAEKSQEKSIQELKREVKTKEDEKTRESDKVKALSKSFRELSEKLNAQKDQYDIVKGLLRQKTSEKEATDMAMLCLTGDVRVLQAATMAKDQRILQMTNEKEEITGRLDATEVRLRSVISLEEKVQQYSEQNRRLRDELERATRGYQQVMATTGDKNSENEKLRQDNTRLAKEIRSCKERVVILLSANKNLEQHNQSLQQDMNDSFSF